MAKVGDQGHLLVRAELIGDDVQKIRAGVDAA